MRISFINSTYSNYSFKKQTKPTAFSNNARAQYSSPVFKSAESDIVDKVFKAPLSDKLAVGLKRLRKNDFLVVSRDFGPKNEHIVKEIFRKIFKCNY